MEIIAIVTVSIVLAACVAAGGIDLEEVNNE